MAVLTPTRQFEGSDLSTNIFGKIIKEGVRVVNFREDKNREGNFFFILPPYKLDANGGTVSWKVIQVRDNFGIDIKETFAVGRNCPVAYFSGKVKIDYPEFAKVVQTQVNNKQVKRYPPFGRVANKVLFNVAYMSQMQLGAHVLVLPQFGGGEHIEAWNRRRMPDGSEAPLLNDPASAIPVFIQLKRDAVGQPWTVTPEASKRYALPTELTDSDYLYNLDEVVHYLSVEELIEKLRNCVPADIFNRCMSGYQLPNGTILGNSTSAAPAFVNNSGTPGPVPVTTAVSAPAAQPVAMPMAAVPKALVPQVAVPAEAPLPVVQTEYASNPTADPAKPVYTLADAHRFLNRTPRTA